MTRAVFLDRDNTIIHNDGDLGNPDEVRLIQGVATAVASLCGLGFKVVVVTNQGGVARGKYAEDDVMLVHERIAQLVQQGANGARIDRFYYCPYHPDGTVEEYRTEHPWRKPQPGMLLQAAEDLSLDLPHCWTIGDQMRDVQAGAAAGTRTVLLHADVREGQSPEDFAEAPALPRGWKKEGGREGAPPKPVKPDYVVRTLVEAVRIIAQARKPEKDDVTRHSVGKKWDAAAVRKLQERISSKPAPIPTEPHAAADTSDAASAPAQAARRTSGKPFRPWSAQPAEEDEPLVNKLRRARRGDDENNAEDRAPQSAPAPLKAVPPPEPEPVSQEEDYAAAAQARVIETRPIETPRLDLAADDDPAPAEEPPQSFAPSGPRPRLAEGREPSPPWNSIDQTLRLMLQEMRAQRGTAGGEFSYLYVLAIVLQLIAAVCLLGGLWMGAADPDLFQRWIAAGLLAQLATISMLLFAR